MLNISVKQIKDKVKKLYETKGQGAAFDWVGQYISNNRVNNPIKYERCESCDTSSPSIEHECLICGQLTQESVETKAERKARLDQEMGLLSFTATKTRKYLLIPIGNISFSFKRRKNKLYIGDVTFFHNENMTMDEATFKSVMKSMKANKTDILTNGTEFFTRTGEREITRISHPNFYSLLDMDDEIKAKINHLRFG